MLAVLAIVTPVFALMAIGFAAAKLRILPDGGGQALAQFAFKIAIPAMLFRNMLTSGAMADSPWRLLASLVIAVACVWLITTLVAAFILKRPAEDQAPLAMGATFGNTVMLGIPIAISAFGQEAVAPLAILIAVEATLMWIVGTLHIEIARRGRDVSSDAILGVLRDLSTNPVVVSLVLGLAGRALGITLPDVPDRIFMLLGQAGVPVALFALGMALATFKVAAEGLAMVTITVLKLALLPALAFAAAAYVFALPPLWIALVTLHAAMPVGANAFLFAARYERSSATISAAIAISTVVAVLTLSLLLLALQPIIGR